MPASDPQPTLVELLEKGPFSALLKYVNRMTDPYQLSALITQAEARLKQLNPDFTCAIGGD